ncbi:Phage tail fiber protein [Salmonella enterica subsp. enterica]|uniref:Phage tail fiber protein n=1 Tax=Salmonella enterica I TaxID=59201 RepID=A0A379WW28_SALET|nr:Phage tail fiber protein [Salmonella enterica subsp. enterica]
MPASAWAGGFCPLTRARCILTLDREITLPSSGTTLISLVDGEGLPVSVDVQSVTDGVQVQVSRIPDGVAEYSVWGLKLPSLRQRPLPVCGCPGKRRRNVCHHRRTACAGKRVHRGQRGIIRSATRNDSRHRSPGDTASDHRNSGGGGTVSGTARWDTPRVVKGASFSLRLNVAAEDGSDRLVSSAGTPDTQYRFRGLTPGRYTLSVRAVNSQGQQGDPRPAHSSASPRRRHQSIYRTHPWLFPDYSHTASGGIRPDGAV